MSLQQAVQLQRQGRLAEAEVLCRLHLASVPHDANALHLLGTIAHRLGRGDEAIDLLSRCVRISPDNAGYRTNFAAALGSAGKAAEALSQLQEAMRLAPTMPELHCNFGTVLESLGRGNEAERAFRKAIHLRPQYPEAYFNLGNVLRKRGDYCRALAAYRESARLRPDYAKPCDGIATCLTELGDAPDAIRQYRRVVELDPQRPERHSALLYTLHYDPQYGAAAIAEEHREWGCRFGHPLPEGTAPHRNDRDPDRKLRIGYVSPDFREHTPPRFIGPAFRYHDRERFELFCYSDVEKPDAMTERLRGWVENWREITGLPDAKVDEMIRADGIDILVDLRGHAASNRMTLFARKPAPVQATMVGYFNTTAVPAMDYRVTDAYQDPPGQTERHHTEKLVRLPGSFWCYMPDEEAPPVAPPPVLENRYITFGSLNKIVKVSEPCAELWSKVLEAVPGSQLLLTVSGCDKYDDVRRTVLDHLAATGLPIERVELVGKSPGRREYLERFSRIDVALDTWPFNGITTTCDGLWMGVPAVSLAGSTSVSRAGRSILHATDLGRLATGSPETYVAAAAGLAADVSALRHLRLGMRDRLLKSPLIDHRGFAGRLEGAYREMWHSYVRG